MYDTEGVPVLDNYKATSVEDSRLYCNCCGEEIIKTAVADTHMDYLHVEKSWGYFSAKDLTTHSFNICEKCYDKWVTSFAIPVEETYIEDIFFYSEEEIRLLNDAYKVGLCK